MELDYHLGKRRQRALDYTDNLPAELRACVHEFGLPIVEAFLKHGVRSPKAIREIVRETWDGARHVAQRREPLGTLDWILIQAGAQITGETLARILQDNHYGLVPLDPSAAMLEASMAEVSDFTARITKREKHRRRLVAANRVGTQHLWKGKR